MFNNVGMKSVASAGMWVAMGGAIAIGVEITKGQLFERQKATAATTAAHAEGDKAKAEMEKAFAEKLKAAADQLRAENELLAAKVTRDGAVLAAQYLSHGQTEAADKNARGLVEATGVDRYVDIKVYDDFTSNFVEPAKAINGFNKQIARLKREAESGIDARSRRFLPEAERADRLAQVRILEEEKRIESDASAANISDMLGVMMKGMGGLGGLYSTGTSVVPTNRRIVQEP